MFQYITTNILNDSDMIKTLSTIGVVGNTTNPSTNTHSEDALVLDGIGLFYKTGLSAEFAPFVPAVKEVVVATLTSGTWVKDDVIRLKIVTSQEGINSAIYADAQLRHRKPFFYEVTSTAKTADITKLAELINKDMAMTDFNFFTAKDDGNGKLTLTADDCYTRFQEIELVKVHVTSTNNTGYQDYESLFSWKRNDESTKANATLTKGDEGMGTVARIIKNIKLPTDANTDVFAADNGGRPLPGAEYDRYVLTYVTDRRHIGGQVMGARDKSETTHIIYAQRNAGSSTVTTAGDGSVSGALAQALENVLGSFTLPAAAQTESKLVTPHTGDKQ